MGKTVQLCTNKSSPFYLCSQPFTFPSTTLHSVDLAYFQQDGVNAKNPWAFTGDIQFDIHECDEEGNSLGSQLFSKPIPLELYVLGNPIADVFSEAIPILLLRMFVKAAVAQAVVTPEQWVALVVKICHGSAKPETGVASSTEEHWLKYETNDGSCEFLVFTAEGKKFLLKFWLESYRAFVQAKKVSRVNCYDQAAAVQVALSLGIDYRSVAWEYHQPFGLISSTTSLVGWGLCNNPYFKDDPTKKIVDDFDPKREKFRNHVFLSWNKDFRWDDDFFANHPNPSEYKDGPVMRAIDACAGPCLGDKIRGDWVHPAKYPLKYSDQNTYYRCRDDKYSHLMNIQMLAQGPDKEKWLDDNVWNKGIMGADADCPPLTVKVPTPILTIENTDVELPIDDAKGSVIGGSFSDFEKAFETYLAKSSTDGWDGLAAENRTANSAETFSHYMKRFHHPNGSPMDYVTLGVCAFPSFSDALKTLKVRLGEVLTSSTVKATYLQAAQLDVNNSSQRNVYMVQSDYNIILQHGNILIQVAGYGINLTPVIQDLAVNLGALPLVDPNMYTKFIQN